MSLRLVALAVAVSVLAASGVHAQAQEGARRDQPKPAAPPPEPQLTRPPELIEAPSPDYPPQAAADKRDGDVKVRISIDAAGAVQLVEVVTPAGHGFDEAAIAAAKQYKFHPAEFDGKPGPITVETTIHFRFSPPPVEEQPATTQVASTQPATSQPTAILTGVVKERGTRRKLTAVALGFADLPDLEIATAADGSFRFDDLPPGKHRLIALAPGFDKFSAEITLVAGETTETAIYLRPSGGNPYETVVTGERERLEVTRRTLTRQELTTVPGTFGDPIRVLQSLPGLARAPFASGLLVIRGSNPNESGIFIDGFAVPLLFHFLGGPSILNPEFLDSLDLYPGGYPARFGRVVGGIVEVNTRSPATDGIHGAADVNLLDTSVYLRAPIGDKVTFAVAARRSYIDLILPLVLPKPDPGDTLTVAPVYYDYQARVDAQLSPTDKLTVLAFGSDDVLSVLSTSAESASTFDLDTHIGFNRLIATYKTKIIDGLDFTLAQMFGKDVFSLAAGERVSTTLDDTVAGTRERISGALRPGLRIDTGLDLEYRVTSYKLNIPNASDFVVRGPSAAASLSVNVPSEEVDRSVDSYALGAYLEFAWDITPKLRLIPSIRSDFYLLNGNAQLSFDPRVVARYAVTDKTTLKAYTGVFHQAPQPEQVDAVFGNPQLGLELAIQNGLGVEQQITKHITLDAEVYYIPRLDLAELSQQVNTSADGTVVPQIWNNEGTGRSYGFELLLKHEVTDNFYGWISYTLAHAEVRPQPDKDLQPTPFDQTHNLVAVGSYKLGRGWEFGARFQFTTGRPITPINGSTFDSDGNVYVRDNGPMGSARRDTFSQLDLRVDKTWLFDTWRIGVFIDVLNVLNAENAEATQYDYRFQETSPVRGVPILPTFGVKGEW